MGRVESSRFIAGFFVVVAGLFSGAALAYGIWGRWIECAVFVGLAVSVAIMARKARPRQRLACGWCSRVIREGREPTSHVMCDNCQDDWDYGVDTR